MLEKADLVIYNIVEKLTHDDHISPWRYVLVSLNMSDDTTIHVFFSQQFILNPCLFLIYISTLVSYILDIPIVT